MNEPSQRGDLDFPITGWSGPLDAVMRQVMDEHGIPGSALAVAKDGRLVLARGYGLADVERHEPVRPEALFGLQSISKTITAIAVMKLVEQGNLRLEDQAFRLLDLPPPAGAVVDPRLYEITVRQLLNHSPGWNTQPHLDPRENEERIAGRLQVSPPLLPVHLVRSWMEYPLDFPPGTQQHYLRVSFVVLGLVIEHVSGRAYGEFVESEVLRPAGAMSVRLGPARPNYAPGEVRRYDPGGGKQQSGGHPAMRDATGGWLGSAADMVRLLTSLDGSRGPALLRPETLGQMLELPPPLKPRDDGTFYGLGWDYVKPTPAGISYAKMGRGWGVEGWLQHLPQGIDWCVLFNTNLVDLAVSNQPDLGKVQSRIEHALAEVDDWP